MEVDVFFLWKKTKKNKKAPELIVSVIELNDRIGRENVDQPKMKRTK